MSKQKRRGPSSSNPRAAAGAATRERLLAGELVGDIEWLQHSWRPQVLAEQMVRSYLPMGVV